MRAGDSEHDRESQPGPAGGGAAGFVVQAAAALVLLATRRIGLRGELPFGPAMLLGALLAIGWSDILLH